MVITKQSSTSGLVVCLLVLAVGVSMSAVALAEGLRDRDAWEVLVPRNRPVDSVWWQGRVVVADDGGGLFLYDPQSSRLDAWTTREGLTSNFLTAVDADTSGNLWVGSRGGGMMRVRGPGVTKAITGLLENSITDLAADGGHVYYGTLSGAGRVAGGFPERVYQTSNGLPSDEVLSVAAFNGIAWFGTPLGVARFDRETSLLQVVNQGLGSNLEVLDLDASAKGTFVSTADGVYAWGDSTWIALPVPPVLVERLVPVTGRMIGLADGDAAYELTDGATSWVPFNLDATSYDFTTLDNGGEIQYPGAVEAPDGTLYFAATSLRPGTIRNDPLTTLWIPGVGDIGALRGLFGSEIRAMAPDGAGGVWLGSFPVFDGITHWRSDRSVVAYALRDADPSDAVDLGWMQALKIAALVDRRGDLWVSTFSKGLTRMRPSSDENPATSSYLHLRPEDSPLRSKRVVAMAEDPKGRLWFTSDAGAAVGDLNIGVDILLDPTDPLNPASWLKLTPANSLLSGPAVMAIDFQGADRVWFSVNGAGIQRWDYDGTTGSGDIEVTTMTDAFSWKRIARLPDTAGGVDLAAPRGLEFTSDGRAWLAAEGNGVFRFDPESSLQPWEVDQIRLSTFGVTLLSSLVRAIALDGRGALWVASDVGLDRITETSEGYRVDAFSDLPTFESRDLGRIYSPDILSPLPTSNLTNLVLDRERQQLYIASKAGAARIDLGQLTSASSGEFMFSVSPNPLRAEDTGFVVSDFDGEATVEVYNLLGVRILRRTGVRAGDQVWDARNRLGDFVAGGMYVLRLQTGAGSAQRTVAIER